MDLGKHVLDKDALDCDGHLAGKVDDIIFEVGDLDQAGESPAVVKAFLSGPIALSIGQPRFIRQVVRQFYRLLGLSNPQPVEIGWEHIKVLDVVVHLDLSREELGLNRLAQAVNQRYIRHIPGA